MEKCECYGTLDIASVNQWGIVRHEEKNICYGTKEMGECKCGGDPSKCDFYPEKRKEKKTTSTTIYYAHHQWKYFTEIEEYELSVIRRYFPHADIFNPATDLKSKDCGYESIIMEECLNTVEGSDILIFSSMDGMVGKGVFEEVRKAASSGKLILYLIRDELTTEYEMYQRYGANDRLYAEIYAKERHHF